MKIYNMVPAVISEPGRLSTELARDKQSVVLKIFEQISRAAVIMGINVEGASAKHNAIEAIDYIKKNYPYAHVDDICQAIKMGAFGQLKFDGQLSTLSASNIFQWYKDFRLNHQDKMVSPPPAVVVTNDEPDEQMKKDAIRASFINFITDPKANDILVDLHFDRLLKIGLNLSNEEKRESFNKEMTKIINNPPIEFYQNKKTREMVREIQTYWDSLEDKHKYNYSLMAENAMHKRAVWASKKDVCIKYIASQDKETLIKKFDEIF
jgi:cellobiose-specific phosphotransferase system component IIA